MSGNLLNIGLSGINVSQMGLNTVSNNIANVNTPGYSRQRVTISDMTPTATTSGFIGNGARVLSVDRLYDRFIATQLRAAESLNASQSAVYDQLKNIDNLLANTAYNLSDGMQDFFNNVQNLVSNPSDAAARQTVIGKAESMVAQFGFVDDYLRNLNNGVNESLNDVVGQINNYAEQIAHLNTQITKARGISAGQEPNQLLDQRDFLVSELNKLVGVTVNEQNGAYNVSFANGLSLVQSNTFSTVSAVRSSADPTRMTIAYSPSKDVTVEVPESQIRTGEVAGLFQFRNTLDATRAQINQIALVFADEFNKQHKAGFDLNGEPGEEMFSIGKPTVFSNSNNNGTAQVTSVERVDTPQMQGTDYRLDYVGGGQWRITRLSDNTVLAPNQATINNGPPVVMEFEGIKVQIDNQANLRDGDNFTIKPVSDAISNFGVLIKDPAKLAAAGKDENGVLETGPSNNLNAKKLLDLQNQNLVSGISTFSGAYAKVVGAIGSATTSAEVNFKAQDNIVNQLTLQQQNLSGVNKDQEYIDLQKFIQHYQASAEVIRTASTIFNALLSIR